MRSRKLQALDFIRRYFAQWGASPSLEEIGGALGVSRQRASVLVHKLSRERQIRHVAGKRRGITLVDRFDQISEAEALLTLSRQGWNINATPFDPDGAAPANPGAPTLTKSGLQQLPTLDHDPR